MENDLNLLFFGLYTIIYIHCHQTDYLMWSIFLDEILNAVNWCFLCCSQAFWCNTTACTCAQPKHRDAGESCFLTIDLLVLLHCCKIFICMQHLLLTSVFHPSKCRALACCLKAYLVLLLVPLFLCKKAMSYEFVMSQNGNVYLKVFLLCSKVSSSCLLVFPYWFCG